VRERRSPFELPFPLHFETVVEIRPPAGHVASGTGERSRGESGAYVTWSIETATERERLVVKIGSRVRAGRFPAGEYARFQKEVDAARRALTLSLEFTRDDQ
jgi:hypothetical protein